MAIVDSFDPETGTVTIRLEAQKVITEAELDDLFGEFSEDDHYPDTVWCPHCKGGTKMEEWALYEDADGNKQWMCKCRKMGFPATEECIEDAIRRMKEDK